MNYSSELFSKEAIAEGTMAFHFEKPHGFAWKAGQSIDLTLVGPAETDAEGNTRAFSIASAPYERDIMIATRMRETAFKRVLRSADLGMKVDIAGPFGSFTLHEKSSRPAIMLVGGIGITPFLSMMKDATERKLPHRIYLYYSNRRPEDAPFLDLLNGLRDRNPRITFIPTMTDMENSKTPWSGERGYITRDMIERHAPDRADAIYYSAGPPGMVAAMRKVVNEMGVGDDDIRVEEFSGY
ncbi:FAD-dependent oxidoreductase [Patescibacteria group bacterium]|nr:MAG: FAD-dependent oxidoreductase [Patescibacteria group bacterium]